MRASTSALLLLLVVLPPVAGCRPSFSDERRDGGIGRSDPDGGSPAPPRPPQCVGTPTPCAERTGWYECRDGCFQRGCSGSATCASLDRDRCWMVEGCQWTLGDLFDRCEGTPTGGCETRLDDDQCRQVPGCDWDSRAPCEGDPLPCEVHTAGTCATDTGCLPADVDAGVDAGPPAPWCPAAPGECDPFLRTCGAGRMCIVDPSLGTRCATTPSGAQTVGETCSTTLRCGSGLDCVELGAGMRCYYQCPAGSVGQCPSGYKCAVLGIDPGGCVDYCLYYGPSCDPVRQDCSGFGSSCYLVRDPETDSPTTFCTSTGTTAVGSTCTFADQCVEGASCIGGTCRQLCNTGADCTRGGSCTGALTGSSYRYCQ